MRAIRIATFVFMTVISFPVLADDGRKGLFFGAAVGVSSIQTGIGALPAQSHLKPSFPNLRLGTMLRSDTALMVYLPGSIFRYSGISRERDRGFEGIMPSLQYWVADHWWVLGGAGFALEAPAFYDVKGAEESSYHFGPGVVAGAGYEFLKKGSLVFDLGLRVHYGSVNVPEGTRRGLAYSLLLGLNWY